jgi:DtxR family Mn-dependent transcriptional regulator
MADLKMSAPPLSEHIEMYLVRVAQLRTDGEPVPLSLLAQELAITSVSANEMCRKLTEKGLVTYTPYKGVTLTAAGEQLAQQVLRCRYLWATFFVEKLGVAPDVADETACRFEHVTPAALADRLATFLAVPTATRPSPTVPDLQLPTCALSSLAVGQQGRICALPTADVIRSFLNQQGLVLGALVTVLGVAAADALLLEVAGVPLVLSQTVTQTITITLHGNNYPSDCDRIPLSPL